MTNDTPITRKVIIRNKLGLHIRAAAKLVDVANQYPAKINIRYQNEVFNGKSIMNLMMLAAKQGTELELIASGDHAAESLNALSSLIDNHFGEGE